MTDFILTQSQLKEILHYDPETGLFTCIKRVSNRMPGSNVGYLNDLGYIKIRINRKLYAGHRLAWLYVHGEFPPEHMDHINHNRSDNKIVNLRCVTNKENHKNRKKKAKQIGVYWHKRDKVWAAKIGVDGALINLGQFKDKSEAIRVRKEAEIKYGFHANHGQ